MLTKILRVNNSWLAEAQPLTVLRELQPLEVRLKLSGNPLSVVARTLAEPVEVTIDTWTRPSEGAVTAGIGIDCVSSWFKMIELIEVPSRRVTVTFTETVLDLLVRVT